MLCFAGDWLHWLSLAALRLLLLPHMGPGAWGSVLAARGLSCPIACTALVPQPGVEPTSPALEGGFLTTRPRGKSPVCCSVQCVCVCVCMRAYSGSGLQVRRIGIVIQLSIHNMLSLAACFFFLFFFNDTDIHKATTHLGNNEHQSLNSSRPLSLSLT